jgi:hypothetical protein
MKIHHSLIIFLTFFLIFLLMIFEPDSGAYVIFVHPLFFIRYSVSAVSASDLVRSSDDDDDVSGVDDLDGGD